MTPNAQTPVSGIIISLCIYLTGVVCFAVINGEHERTALLSDIDQRLSLAAKSLKHMLAPDFHDRAMDAASIPPQEATRNRITISSFAAETEFVYLYTIVESKGGFFFAAPTVTEEELAIRENWYFLRYDDIPPDFTQALATMQTTFVNYTDQWGTFRSVAIPETAPAGRPYLACADLDIGYLNSAMWKAYLRSAMVGLFFLLLTIPFILVFRSFNKRLVHTNEDLQNHRNHLEDLVVERTQELQSAKLRAEKANRLKTVFLNSVSHEIRTPLNGIIGFAELVKQGPVPQETRQQAAHILTSGKDLNKLVDELLDHARIASGRIHIVAHPFCLKGFLESLVESFRIQASKKNLSFHFIMEDGLPEWVLGDTFRLRQVLLNLLNNALKFTPLGQIALNVSTTEAENCGSGNEAKRHLCFSVSDSGIGISPDKLETIFDPFVQADDGTERLFGGTGLGTTIARQLVESMGGHIHAENHPHHAGSHFWFVVPFTVCEAPSLQPSVLMPLGETATDNGRASAHVLVVDDYATNRILAKSQLEDGGHRVTVAGNGIEALSLCKKHIFSLILLDVHMAGMDGYATARLIRSGQGNCTRVPILALTASADAQTRDQCLECGMDDVLTKPLGKSLLLAKVAQWIAQNHTDIPVPTVSFQTATNTETGSTQPLDWETALAEFENDSSLLRHLLYQFLEQTERQTRIIAQALKTQDYDSIVSQAHALRGGAANLTATAVATAAGQLETAGNNREAERSHSAFMQLQRALRRLQVYVVQSLPLGGDGDAHFDC